MVGGVGRPHGRRAGPRALDAAGSDLPQDLLLGDPGPADMFDDRVYKRGALLLHALRLTVGDDAFFALLRAWVEQHTYGSVTTPMFVVARRAVLRDPPACPLRQLADGPPAAAAPVTNRRSSEAETQGPAPGTSRSSGRAAARTATDPTWSAGSVRSYIQAVPAPAGHAEVGHSTSREGRRVR